MAKQPTIKDVATEAGVSTATVSFVLNDVPGQSIGQAVRDRIRRAAQHLDYHPNASAVNLARRGTRNVAIALYEQQSILTDSCYSQIVEGALKLAVERNYQLLLSCVRVDYRGRDDLPAVITQRNTQGVLFIKRLVSTMVADISAIGIPMVAIDHYPPSPLVGSISLANARGGELAAEHLTRLGHSRLAVVAGDLERKSDVDRAAGFSEELERLGILPGRRPWLWKSASFTIEGGFDAAIHGFHEDPQVTGVFCVNDALAAGVIRAAHQLGYRVPEQLSVIGYDDIDVARYLDPPLTTISVNRPELGRKGMNQLIDLIEGRVQGVSDETVDVELVVRGSTGSAPARRAAATYATGA